MSIYDDARSAVGELIAANQNVLNTVQGHDDLTAVAVSTTTIGVLATRMGTTIDVAEANSRIPPALVRPVLVSPKVIRLDRTTRLSKLDTNYDYIIVLPTTGSYTSGLRIVGGRNVMVVGGYLSTSSGKDPNFYIGEGAPGSTVWAEGLLIDGKGGGLSDAFHLQCPTRHVQLYNNRVDGLNGSYSTTHADVIQNLGTASLRVESLTGRSHYNTAYLRRENDPVGFPVGPSTWNKVNMGGYTTNPNAMKGDPVHTLRALSLGTQPIPPGAANSSVNSLLSSSVWLSEYYANCAEAGQTLGQFVWPHDGKSMDPSCRAQVSADGKSVDWPVWRASEPPPLEETTASSAGTLGSGDAQVYGVVQLGPPAGGDFVPAGSVGLAYPRIA